MTHILLADDDKEFSALLVEYLRAQDLDVTAVYDGQAALDSIQSQAFDLVVLDIMMPQIDGLSVLRQLPTIDAATANLPVIMLTAKGDDIDRIVGLELGADDYIGKPCNPRELLARIHAVLKRTHRTDENPSGTSTVSESSQAQASSIFTLDTKQRRCHVGETTITLTGTEFDLLHLLLRHKGEAVDKHTLSRQVLQRELQPFDRSLDVHVSRLRKKLSQFHDDPIRTVRGKGYQLVV